MAKMWMVRSEGGRYYEDFRDRNVAAIGWREMTEYLTPGLAREELLGIYLKVYPNDKPASATVGSSQIWRFMNEMAIGDNVVTYSPLNRTYLVGTIDGSCAFSATDAEDGMAFVRPVKWLPLQVSRDLLSEATRARLGPTLTVFVVADSAKQELMSRAHGAAPVFAPEQIISDEETATIDPLAGIDITAIERIKDLVSKLGWAEMQELVAGILRAMGYRTQVSPPGADRGKDIVASPDGFGFENPRIVVEVKHQKDQMGTQQIRSFLAVLRHSADRGLYVSTGGFSKDSWYEAERSTVPVALWTLDNLVRALVEIYDKTDAETKRLVPLKRLYIPA
jgi:restriction system protein